MNKLCCKYCDAELMCGYLAYVNIYNEKSDKWERNRAYGCLKCGKITFIPEPPNEDEKRQYEQATGKKWHET
jgi:RNase P subunit RPR2